MPFALSKTAELLPLAAGNYKLREAGVSLEDIECLTKTTVKVRL